MRHGDSQATQIRCAPSLVAVFAALVTTSPLHAQTLFSGETAFQQAAGNLTLVNLDGPPLDALVPTYNVEDPDAAAAFLSLGLDFIIIDTQVLDGQAYQISKPGRDRLILNATGLLGAIAFDLVTPMRAVGVWTNDLDGGRIQAYSQAGLGGTLLAEAAFGGASNFGGMLLDDDIGSVRITCDFDFDLICGLFDIQFGTPDSDGDGAVDNADNCIDRFNPDQFDTDADNYGNRCDPDFNNDCVVNATDLGLFKAHFFTSAPLYDLNGDGIVATIDLGILKSLFFAPPGPSGIGGGC